ncbi:hypothetical protein BOTBODRAFT_224854 [Botryobasidium botryosum FD-172 SS1]|uniref:F-box domain-containing protein n=1 Tax=Botryobasidium botryosum (strain FD-172 SS1) TaxID=930990 RepID=A0A067MNG0_BOTB1|nr:hypothetical protein BOTBODRAFT_224854 [Botryobasidium botryosum FD-172 SS1]
MPRWKRLVLAAPPHEIRLFLDICTGYTPNLSNLSIELRGEPRSFSDESPILLIPFQRSSEAGLGPPASTSFTNCLPLFPSFGPAVTELAVNATAHITDYINMLLTYPNLVRCDLAGTSWLIDPEHLLGALRLEALQSLCIIDFEWAQAMPGVLRRAFQTCDLLTTINITRGRPEPHSDGGLPSPSNWGWITLPSVKNFTWYASAVAYPLHRLSLPRVQTFRVGNIPYDIAYSLVSPSTQLTSASISDLVGEVPQHASIITFPNLSSLYLGGSLELLGCMSTPHLNALTLTEDNVDHQPPASELLRGLIERPNPLVHELRLYNIGFSDEEAIWCLRRLPHIETLRIQGCLVSDVILHALEIPPPSEQGVDIPLPRLKWAMFILNSRLTAQGIMSLASSRNASPITAMTGAVSDCGLSSRDREMLKILLILLPMEVDRLCFPPSSLLSLVRTARCLIHQPCVYPMSLLCNKKPHPSCVLDVALGRCASRAW